MEGLFHDDRRFSEHNGECDGDENETNDHDGGCTDVQETFDAIFAMGGFEIGRVGYVVVNVGE